jgi:hypothetical protein
MAKVRQLQPGIEAVIKNLLSRMEECRLSKTSLPASIAYTAMTNGEMILLTSLTLPCC